MALELISAVGPELNHAASYYFFDSNATRPTVVSTPAPSQGTYRFETVGDGNRNQQRLTPQDTFTAKNFVWACIRQFRLSGTLLATSSPCEFFTPAGELILMWRRQSNTTYTIDVTPTSGANADADKIITGTTVLNTDTDYALRLEFSGSIVKFWINGVLEGSAASTRKPSNEGISVDSRVGAAGGMEAGMTMRWARMGMFHSDLESDRPGTAVSIYRLDPNGNVAGENDHSLTACNNNLDGTFTAWDDYTAGGAPNNDTDYNCAENGAARTQTSDLTTATIVNNIMGVIVKYFQAANVTSKTVNSNARLKSGGTGVNQALTNTAVTSYVTKGSVYRSVPGGGSWTQTVIDGLQAGHNIPTGNGAHLKVTAMAVEVCSVDSDPPPTIPARSFGYIFG